MILAIKTGKADAGLSGAEPLRERMREDNTLGALGVNFFSFPEGVGFRKENTALRDEFNGFLANLKQDGTLADMVKRWVDNNISAMRAIANAGTNGELVVGFSDGTLPFVAAKND